MEKAEKSLNVIEGIQKRPVGELHTLLRQLHECVRLTQVPVTCLHDDYHPGNIFVTRDGKVGALDPNWVEGGPIYADLATMLIYPVTNKIQLITQGLVFGYSMRQRYERAFLRGYMKGFQVSCSILYLYCAFAVIEKWQDIEELLIASNLSLYRIGAFFIKAWLRVYFRHFLKDYILRGLQS